jgi:hypothetical protein
VGGPWAGGREKNADSHYTPILATNLPIHDWGYDGAALLTNALLETNLAHPHPNLTPSWTTLR